MEGVNTVIIWNYSPRNATLTQPTSMTQNWLEIIDYEESVVWQDYFYSKEPVTSIVQTGLFVYSARINQNYVTTQEYNTLASMGHCDYQSSAFYPLRHTLPYIA